MIKFRIYQAECGDAARLYFLGDDNLFHNILIDSGYERTYRDILLDEINEIKDAGEFIDLWLISHIHDDHIGGSTAYIEAIKDGETPDLVKKWYYNIPRHSNVLKEFNLNISNVKSIDQGDLLSQYIHQNHQKLEITSNFHSNHFGLDIKILSPDLITLEKLKNKYKHVPNLEKIEDDYISEVKYFRENDYSKKIEDFNLDYWNEDNSIENASSISCLTEYKNVTFLWLADSHPSIVINGLKNYGYSLENPLICNYVKVSHHGSKGNNSDALYDLIRSNNYIISADGENRHCLPTKECIVRILMNKYRNKSHYNFYLPYDNKTLRSIFSVDGKDVFKRYNFSLHFSSEKYFEFNI